MIPEMLAKCKAWVAGNSRTAFYGITIVLVALISFGLGRISRLEELRTPVTIERISTTVGPSKSPVLGAKTETEASKNGSVVASKTGSKYHLPWCSGAARISEAKKVIFASEEEAQKAGYGPAANCPELQSTTKKK